MNNLDQGSVTDEEAAAILANGHPKSEPVPVRSNDPGEGSAPGANGPPTTGAVGPGGPLSAT